MGERNLVAEVGWVRGLGDRGGVGERNSMAGVGWSERNLLEGVGWVVGEGVARVTCTQEGGG